MVIELFGVPASGKSTYKKYISDPNVVLPLDLYLYRASRVMQNLNKVYLVAYAFRTHFFRCIKLNGVFWKIDCAKKKVRIKMWLYLFSVLGAKWKGEKKHPNKTIVMDEGVNQVVWGIVYNSGGMKPEIELLQKKLVEDMGKRIIWLNVGEEELANRLMLRKGRGGSELEHEVKENPDALKDAIKYAHDVVCKLNDKGIKVESIYNA